MRYLACTLSLIFAFAVSSAQDIQTSGPTASTEYDSIRNYYIKHFPDYFFLYPVFKQRNLSFTLEKSGSDENMLTFKPNKAYSFGVGAYLLEVGFELAFAIPLGEKRKSIYGESEARDIQLNVLGKKWGLDAYYQRYQGFYVTDSSNPVPADTPYPQRPDVKSRNIGITGTYIFNHQKFSFRSAYNFAEHQVFSKGSFLVAATMSTFRFIADSAIVDDSQRVVFGDDVAFRKLRYATFSISPGYTYSIVFNNFFLNGTLVIGPAQNWIKYGLEGGEDSRSLGINTFIGARLSLGYNGERVFGGISFLSQGNQVKFKDVTFANNNGSFKILVGYRFREFGFLRNRLWDMIPFKI